MCGIAGFTGTAWDCGEIDEAIIRRMTGSLLHRGPDQQGCYYWAGMALGAVRLRVIDLDGGDQPLQSGMARPSLSLMARSITSANPPDLEARGHRFRSQCDTEVALRAFLEWDTDCFERFRGMFAMAIWSEARSAARSGARSHGHQAAVPPPRRPRYRFRLRTEGSLCPSAGHAHSRPLPPCRTFSL